MIDTCIQKSCMTKLMKNYQFFTFGWFKSLSPTLTNMSMNHKWTQQAICAG